jgi:predicted RecA/RadA family phage recombinase
MMSYTNYAPFATNDVEAQHVPGTVLGPIAHKLFVDDGGTPSEDAGTGANRGGIYIAYYRVEDADVSRGDVVYPASATGDEVTADISGGSRLGESPAGIALDDIDDGNYGYFQVSGLCLVPTTMRTGDATAGDPIYGYLSTNGTIDTGTVGTDFVIGTALANSSSSVLAAGALKLLGMM